MSAKVVVPDSIISSAASRVPARTNSGDTVFASAGKMYFCSQSISARSSARPRIQHHRRVRVRVDQPGHDDLAGASIVSRPRNCARDRVRRVDGDDVGAVDGDARRR